MIVYIYTYIIVFFSPEVSKQRGSPEKHDGFAGQCRRSKRTETLSYHRRISDGIEVSYNAAGVISHIGELV